MAISDTRRREFEARGEQEIRRWLQVATETFFGPEGSRDAFAPFELFIGTRESVASDIRAASACLSPQTQSWLREAVSALIAQMPPDPGIADRWRFAVELSWLLPAPDAVATLESRLTDSFISSLFRDDERFFGELFGFLLNAATASDAAVKALRRLARCSRFRIADSRRTLLRLCELAPSRWTEHVALLRDPMHGVFKHVREHTSLPAMLAMQDELAEDLLGIVGFENFTQGLGSLHLVGDGASRTPSDNWLHRALFERTGAIRVSVQSERIYLSSRDRPHENYPLPAPVLETEVFHADRGRRQTGEAAMLADDLLGPDVIDFELPTAA